MNKSKNVHHDHNSPPEIVSHAVWLYHRFTLSFRDIDGLLVIRIDDQIPAFYACGMEVVWDSDGEGMFSSSVQLERNVGESLTIKAAHCYATAGDHFVTLRVSPQRKGNGNTPYTLIRYLDRVRIVVK